MSTKILFFIYAFKDSYSFGETTHAKLFAQQLPKDKYECFFAVPEWTCNYIKNAGFKVIDYKDIPQHQFDMVIVSDYFGFIQLLSIKDVLKKNTDELDDYAINMLKSYLYLLSLNIPIGIFDVEATRVNVKNVILNSFNNTTSGESSDETYDGYEFEERKKCIYQHVCIKFLESDCSNCVPPQTFFIHLCPPADPSETSLQIDKKQYFWAFPYSQKAVDQVAKQTKTVFMIHTLWQYNISKLQGFSFYYFILERLLIYYLVKLQEKTEHHPLKLIIATPFMFYYPFKMHNLEVHPMYYSDKENIPNSIFENTLFRTDLMLSDNLIQNSFHRAILNGCMGINLRNTLPKHKNPDGSYTLEPEFQFSETTLEALNLLESTQPLISTRINTKHESAVFKGNNSFMQLIKSVELLDENTCVDAMYKALFDQNYKNEFDRNRESYLSLIDKLPKAEDIVGEILLTK